MKKPLIKWKLQEVLKKNSCSRWTALYCNIEYSEKKVKAEPLQATNVSGNHWFLRGIIDYISEKMSKFIEK